MSRNINTFLRERVLRKNGYVCQSCSADLTKTEIEIDHIVPYSQRGTSTEVNLQALCKTCNRDKRDRLNGIVTALGAWHLEGVNGDAHIVYTSRDYAIHHRQILDENSSGISRTAMHLCKKAWCSRKDLLDFMQLANTFFRHKADIVLTMQHINAKKEVDEATDSMYPREKEQMPNGAYMTFFKMPNEKERDLIEEAKAGIYKKYGIDPFQW